MRRGRLRWVASGAFDSIGTPSAGFLLLESGDHILLEVDPFLLMESGDHLLLESGDRFVLEVGDSLLLE